MKRSTIKRRAPRRTKDPAIHDPKYLEWIRTQECVCCMRSVKDFHVRLARLDGLGIVEAHHAGEHGLSQRPPDRTAIPLCAWHHREGPHSAHVLGRNFWDSWSLNRDALVARLNANYDAQATDTL